MVNDELTKLKTIKKDLIVQLLEISNAVHRLILLIKLSCEFEPVSKQYQKEWLSLIDEQLEEGQTSGSFWMDKIKKL